MRGVPGTGWPATLWILRLFPSAIEPIVCVVDDLLVTGIDAPSSVAIHADQIAQRIRRVQCGDLPSRIRIACSRTLADLAEAIAHVIAVTRDLAVGIGQGQPVASRIKARSRVQAQST